MTNPGHHTLSQLTDPHPVRPGTSAALTARTIDATIHPPIVRAQEAVAAFIPRVAAPLSAVSPLLVGMLASTLVLLWVAHRARFRPAGLLFSAALMLMLTSFHPVTAPADSARADNTIVGATDTWTPQDRYQMPMPAMETPEVVDVPETPEAMPEREGYSEPDGSYRIRNYRIVIPPQLRSDLAPTEELMRLEQEAMREQLRASLRMLERRLRAEARQRERELRRRW
ncbi:MAG TPA: hypothetical protein VHL12_04985 [Gemmatimonadaceae bacterium]|nr:hypothetical protein [Gemmatimonadaceae bacterium]